VKAALWWYFAMQVRMQSPRGVQYGRVDVEAVLAEVATIRVTLARLAAWDVGVHDVVMG
jgi:hypothetical protein